MSEELLDAVIAKKVPATKAALAKGADPNATFQGQTMLIWAIRKKSKDVANVLIEAGADVTKVDGDKRSALHWAALSLPDAALVEKLIARGAKPTQLDGEAYAPIHVGASHLEFVEALIKHGADIDTRSGDEGLTPLLMLCKSESGDMSRAEIASALWFIKHGADVNAVTKDKTTAIHLAAAGGSVEVVKALLAKKATIANDQFGNGPLHTCVNSEDKKTEIWGLLIKAGCDVNQQNKDGTTPLREAQSGENLVAVKYLLSQGADASIKDNNGETPLESSRRLKMTKIIALLERAK